MSVARAELPQDCLLLKHNQPNDYLDCFAVDIPAVVNFEDYVAAFYTTWLFKCERFVLRLAGLPSTDQQALRLGRGDLQAFAAWRLEARRPDQLLMRDVTGATSSWLMAVSNATGTRLYFGSGVKARKRQADGSARLPPGYRVLMGLHVFYSQALLAAAARKLRRELHAQRT